MAVTEQLNCVDIVAPFVRAMEGQDTPDMQMLGGIGSAALVKTSTIIAVAGERVIAKPGLFLPQYRDDGNLRDADILVVSADPADIQKTKEVAEKHIGERLEISVFGLHNDTKLETQHRRPFGWSGLKTFLSDRYVTRSSTTENPSVKRALFPFAVPIDPDAMGSWTLEVEGLEIPIQHPGATILNYMIRSVSGLRAKDQDKVQKMANAIFTKEPDILEWIVDGPGKDQLEFARILHTLREPEDDPQTLVIGGKLQLVPLTATELADHPALMIHDARAKTQQRAIALARFKAQKLHALESNPTLVTLFQRFAEQRMGAVVNNT